MLAARHQDRLRMPEFDVRPHRDHAVANCITLHRSEHGGDSYSFRGGIEMDRARRRNDTINK